MESTAEVEQAPRLADKIGTPLAAQLAGVEALPPARFRLTHGRTALYEQPDGWSCAIELPEGSIVTPEGREGQFIRVATSRGPGYIAQATSAVRIEDGH